MLGVGSVIVVLKLTTACRLNFVRLLVKWISLYFARVKLILCLSAYAAH
jgi:hypothetical protein